MANESIEDIEREAAEAEAKLAELRRKKAGKVGKGRKTPVRDGDRLRSIQEDQSVKSYKTNVALEYPAWTDDNGITWYRPHREPGLPVSQWGWTSQPQYAHADYKLPWSSPKTPLGKLEKQMDKRRKIMEDMVIKHGMEECLLSTVYIINKGRYEGIAGSLAILRGSSVRDEMSRSNERLGIS